ncbi:MAG: molecular chaperone DnaK [Desulfobulbaceae bacterium BRH_c16a]|nr:MAG: molecular chaperone DnaK [Desulfobulbaceae bacterium BRH_c16a]
MSEPAYIIGIDLGTTNSVVAYTEATTERIEDARIRIFDIPQVVEAGAVETRRALPSFVLAPQTQEVPEGALGLPWNETAQLAVGEYARNRGEEIPQRLVSSAKSWLCNTLVDRKAPILPWQGAGSGTDADEGRKKMSPVEAQSAILTHIRDAWNHTMAATDSDSDRKMENQLVYLTVPASFDAVARELTIEAAEMAGLSHAVLLEEPQAAFYAWIGGGHGVWRDAVTAGDLILVCDVGGGTSDFSLIQVGEEEGDLTLERVAVGNHLLVGGDNMDLALAYSLARDLAEKGTRLDTRQMNGLWHSCRRAKEELLSDPDLDSRQVTILGRGASLIGGMITTELTRDTVDSILRDGFFPECKRSDRPKAAARAGIQEFGLAFEADAAITRHLAAFLDRPDDREKIIHPTGVLFNGGVMKAALLRERIVSILGDWTENGSIREIEAGDYDLAVARGAAYYGLARQGKGIRIRSGLERSYYIGVAAAMPAVPGMPVPTKALCVAPFGMEEGSSMQIKDQEFILVVGQPVVFDFLGSTTRREDAVGTVVEDWHDQIEALTTLETTLAGEPGQVIPVTLELEVTEVGTLQLYCASKADNTRWKLEFNVREQ